MEPTKRFPQKPNFKSSNNKKISKTKAVSNFYEIKLTHNKSKKDLFVLSWSLILKSEIPLDARRTYDFYVKKFRKDIIKDIGFFIASGQKIYSIGNPDDLKEMNFKYVDEKEENPVTLEINLNKDVYHMNSFSANEQDNYELIKVFNLIVKSVMQKMGLQELGYNKKYFDNKPDEVNLGDWSFLVLKGIKSSVGLCEAGLRINLDYNVRITRYYNLWEETKFLMDEGQRFDQIIEDNVIGKSFILLHANYRYIRVDSVDRKMKITDAFPNKKYSDYRDYFKKKYHYDLEDKSQFFCVSIEKQYNPKPGTPDHLIKTDRSGKKFVEQHNHYPSELLRPTGMLDSQRKDRKAMQAFSKHTKLWPKERLEKIEKFIRDFNKVDPKSQSKTKDRVVDFGPDVKIQIVSKTNDVPAIILDFPKIQSGKGNIKPNPRNGTYIMREEIYSNGFVMENYALVYDSYQSKNVKKVLENLKKCSKAYGIRVKNPRVSFEINSRNAKPEQLRDAILDEDDRVEIILFVVGNRNSIYSPMKAYFAKQGVMTQFFTNVGFKTSLSVYSNVLLQKVAKSQGVLRKVENAFENKKQLNTLVGVDIVRSKQDILVALCASRNNDFTQFTSIIDKVNLSTKKATREIIAEKISHLMGKVYKSVKKENNKFPDNLVVYRMGSGNSTGLDEDLRFEALQCLENINSINTGSKKTKLIYFAVACQVAERIFKHDKNKGAVNPLGGMIVSTEITRRDRFEFTMVAQNVNQGSANPTKYNCVFNDTEFNENEIEKTTYYQTFNYANWAGPIKIPSVAMYAQKCSQFWADNLKNRRNKLAPMLQSDFLYFL